MIQRIVNLSLTGPSLKSFSKLMTSLERRELRHSPYRWNYKVMYDDIYFAHDQSLQNGGVEAVTIKMKNNLLVDARSDKQQEFGDECKRNQHFDVQCGSEGPEKPRT